MNKPPFKVLIVFVLVIIFNCQNEPYNGELETSIQFDCSEIYSALEIASSNFNAATDYNYETLCNAYKFALLTKINVCGDLDGSLQEEIDDLENCDLNSPIVEIRITTDSLIIEFDLVEVIIEDSIIKVTGQTSDASLILSILKLPKVHLELILLILNLFYLYQMPHLTITQLQMVLIIFYQRSLKIQQEYF